MDILKMTPEQIKEAVQPKSVYSKLNLVQAIKLLEEYNQIIYDQQRELNYAADRASKLSQERSYYSQQVWDREQAERSSQGIFS